MSATASQQERQLVELLREWTGKEEYQLTIERRDGAWDITLLELGTHKAARGTGATFDAAWDDMAPTWA